MKVVILCGGKGTRLREETEFRPKPMLPIGGRPILWHIMKIYAAYGHTDFILCLGYKGEVIKNYFRDFLWAHQDVTLRLDQPESARFHGANEMETWNVTLADTGQETLTAGRIQRIEKYLGDDKEFLLTYGDGVGNINIPAGIDLHRKTGKTLTLTAVHPPGRFGELSFDPTDGVTSFNEKPQTEGGWINGGFFVASRSLLSCFVEDAEQQMMELEPMRQLAAEGRLGAYRHQGFWQPMDTFQEYTLLNRLWNEGKAPWKIW